MFRLIKIFFNACILVLAFVGFNAIGGEKYVDMAKSKISEMLESYSAECIKKVGNFSDINEEYQIDNAVNLMGYKAVIAEHKASGQKMVILDSGKKPLLTQQDINSSEIDNKLNKLSQKFRYQGVSAQDIKVVSRGKINIYGQNVPYAKFEAQVTKLPFSEISGIIASVKTSDNSEKLALSVSEKKKYSQLITNEFYKGVSE